MPATDSLPAFHPSTRRKSPQQSPAFHPLDPRKTRNPQPRVLPATLWPANNSSVKSELRSKLKSGIPRKMQNMFKSTINVICLNKRTQCETFKLLNGEVEAPAPALWLANHSSVKSELRYKLKSCLPRKMKNMFKSTINVIYLNKRTQCETFKLLKKNITFPLAPFCKIEVYLSANSNTEGVISN